MLIINTIVFLVTPGLLYFAIFCQIFEKIRLKTLLNPEIPPDCNTFFYNSPGETTVQPPAYMDNNFLGQQLHFAQQLPQKLLSMYTGGGVVSGFLFDPEGLILSEIFVFSSG